MPKHAVNESPPGRRVSTTMQKRMDAQARRAGTKAGVVLPSLPEDEHLTTKSLQISHDERYDRMDYYRQNGGTADSGGHFARICQKNRRMHGLQADNKQVSSSDGFDDIAAREVNDELFDGERIMRVPAASVSNRVDWQESFDRSVKRLFVDFELTQAPGPRLSHLDRMHAWFNEHGAKQTRKVKKPPSYIMMDPKGAPLPGSTKNLPGPSSSSTSAYADAFASPFQSPCLSARGKS